MWPFTKKKSAPPPKPEKYPGMTAEEVADLKYSAALHSRRPRALKITGADWKSGKANYEITCSNCKHTITTQMDVDTGRYETVRRQSMVCWKCGAHATIGEMQDALNKIEKQQGGIFDDEENTHD